MNVHEPMSRAATKGCGKRNTGVPKDTDNCGGPFSEWHERGTVSFRVGALRNGQIKVSGADAPGGNTRTHPEHDG